MKQIPLTKGQFALVDDEDFEYLNQWKWYAAYFKKKNVYYAYRTENKGTIKRNIGMHRQLMNAPKGLTVDHRNHNSLDNQKNNLRIATRQQNLWNRRKNIRNTSGHIGVYWDKARNKWHAQINDSGIVRNLGRFDKVEDAISIYDKTALKLRGEFAMINKIGDKDV